MTQIYITREPNKLRSSHFKSKRFTFL